MTEPRPAAGPPSRSGVRRFGDHYQDLIAWGSALQLILPTSELVGIDMELRGVGNVDDVVMRSARGSDRYKQVKWATATADLLTTAYLTARPPRGRSLLEKFLESWRLLSSQTSAPPVLELVTNRALDRGDALLALCDGRTDLLTPAARTVKPNSAAGQTVREWASHLGVPVDELLAMLERLRFRTGLTVSGEQEHAQALMAAAGLRSDEDALELGIDTVAKWVREGRRSLVPDEVRAEVDALRLGNGPARAVLLVQAIARDPHPEDATEVVDVVDLYAGDSPPERRRMRHQSGWQEFSDRLDAAVDRLRGAGHRNVLVRGPMRLGTFFVVGSRLAQVTGISVAYLQYSTLLEYATLWSSNAPFVAVPPLEPKRVPIRQGNDLAIAYAMSTDPTAAVRSYLQKAGVPVRELVTFLPAGEAHDQAVAGPGEAVALAQAIRNGARRELEGQPAERVHLFQAGPGGLALLLGHHWNRVAPTVVYEDLGAGKGYLATVTVQA